MLQPGSRDVLRPLEIVVDGDDRLVGALERAFEHGAALEERAHLVDRLLLEEEVLRGARAAAAEAFDASRRVLPAGPTDLTRPPTPNAGRPLN